MTNIERLSSSSPQRIGSTLTNLFFEDSNQEDNCIELIISIESEKLSIKEFSTYLDFIYRVDGMTSELGYNRYVQIPRAQIEITEIKFGSLLLIIEKFINELNANNLIIIGLCLKYLPQVIKTSTEAGVQIFEMLNKREDYLEKKDRRKLRKIIRDSINEDESLHSINKNLKEKLIDLLDEVYVKNLHRVGPASRFANKSVKSVNVRTKRKNKNF